MNFSQIQTNRLTIKRLKLHSTNQLEERRLDRETVRDFCRSNRYSLLLRHNQTLFEIVFRFLFVFVSLKIENQSLNAPQQSIVSIASFTAVGNLPSLKMQLNAGLDAGLTINEIKEVLVQMYAYCGFPRCLNGINTFMTVVEERKTKGIIDVAGKEASPIIDEKSKYETGKQTLQKLTGIEEKGPKTGAAAFTPIIDTFLKEHLFADIFSRDVLTCQQRELATISVLSALDGVAPQLQFHLGVGLNIGLTESQLNQLFSIIQAQIGEKQAEVAKNEFLKMKR